MTKESVEKKYEIAFEQAAALQPIFPEAAKREMAQMVEVIARGNENINAILSRNPHPVQSTDIAIKGGFIAEEFHAETFNMDAVLKGDDARAYTDRYSEWFELDWNGAKLRKDDVPDIVVSRDGEVTTTAQSKYYESAEKTAAEMSQTKDGTVKYEKVDSLLGPEDQVNSSFKNVPGEGEPVETMTIKDHAEAKAEALQTQNADESRVNAYKQTAAKAKDKIQDGQSSSTALSKEDADALGSGNKSKLKQIESDYQTASTLKQMGNAAVGAAAMSAVVSGSVNTLKYIQLANNGELTAEEATVKILGETVASAADSAVKASANAGVQSLMVRYGSEEAAMQILAQQGMKNMLKTNAVTVGVTCAVDAVKDLVRLGTGQISTQEFFDRQGKGVLMTSAGVAGSALGTAAGAGVATALGLSSGTLAVTVVEFIGGMSGGMIAGLAMALAIENGIEKPYRDLVRNTENLKAAACELERVSRNVFRSQILFTKYLEADYRLEKELQTQLDRVDEAGQRAFEAISKI